MTELVFQNCGEKGSRVIKDARKTDIYQKKINL